MRQTTLSRKKSLKKYNNSGKNKENQKRYRQTEKWKLSQIKYRKTEKNRLAKKKYQDKKMKDPFFRISRAIGGGIWYTMRKEKSNAAWQDLVGYSLQTLKEHLEKQFDNKMTWDNYGSYWHIDHIKPKVLFTKKEVKDCWSINNLQPLEKIANLKKGKKYENSNKSFKD